ncbi:MAG: hypothetical protein LZF62_300053 [Nitrospira sp.]|nr:MAG: hypothetical protein LZF62_300053 [Nitrospira sp.]
MALTHFRLIPVLPLRDLSSRLHLRPVLAYIEFVRMSLAEYNREVQAVTLHTSSINSSHARRF